jgi:hypothetical protein
LDSFGTTNKIIKLNKKSPEKTGLDLNFSALHGRRIIRPLLAVIPHLTAGVIAATPTVSLLPWLIVISLNRLLDNRLIRANYPAKNSAGYRAYHSAFRRISGGGSAGRAQPRAHKSSAQHASSSISRPS